MKIRVLDQGYVELVEAWGHGADGSTLTTDNPATWGDAVTLEEDYECGIIEAARQSTQGSFRGWAQDAKLLKYLYEHKHATPFEFAGMTIEVQAPIFVFREWHRHRTQSYNEASARYSPLPDLYYLPDALTTAHRAVQAVSTKQAAGVEGAPVPGIDQVQDWIAAVETFYQRAEKLYQLALTMGIPKELARITMPVGHYSRMRASANLRNWLSFLTLRTAPQAQWEIRQFAGAVAEIIHATFPQTYELWFQSDAVPIGAQVGA